MELGMALNGCPCRLGASLCQERLGHDGLHTASRELDKNLFMEVMWSDEWLGLSAEAELQIGGTTCEVALA